MDRRMPNFSAGSDRTERIRTRVRWYGLGIATVLLPVALAACSPASEPGAVTADEAHQLNEAAAMLDANSVDLNAVVAAPDGTAPDTDISSNQSDQTR